MIYRLHEAGRNGNPGANGDPIITLGSSAVTMQIVYTAIGIGCFVAFLVFIREPRVLQRYTYILGLIGRHPDRAARLPAVAASAGWRAPAPRSRSPSRRLGSLQPEEFAKLALAASFAGYLVAKRDVLSLAGRRVLGIDLPRGRDMGPIAVVWAGQPAAAGLRERHRHQRGVHGHVRRDDLHRDVADLVAAHRVRRLRGRSLHRRPALHPRGRPVQRLAAPVQPAEPLPCPQRPPARVPAGAGPVRDGQRRPARPRGSATASRSGRRSCRAT